MIIGDCMLTDIKNLRILTFGVCAFKLYLTFSILVLTTQKQGITLRLPVSERGSSGFRSMFLLPKTKGHLISNEA